MATYCSDCGKPVELVDQSTEWLPTCIGCGREFRDAEQYGWVEKGQGATAAKFEPVVTIEVNVIRADKDETEKE